MIAATRQDAKDLREVASILRSGNIREARDKAGFLDTIVRDAIPDEPWNFMQENS